MAGGRSVYLGDRVGDATGAGGRPRAQGHPLSGARQLTSNHHPGFRYRYRYHDLSVYTLPSIAIDVEAVKPH